MNKVSKKKKTGATFTPESLANFLADKLLHYCKHINDTFCVLDPACGNGALLAAMCKKKDVSSIIGYDTNESYLTVAKKLIAGISRKNDSQFYNEDFLTVCPNNQDLFSNDIKREFADLIIANPPYVRTQILGAEKAQQLAKDFKLTGRIDLYYPFFMAMTNALKTGGLIGVITSNRYICTKSGSDIRKYLLENYHVLEVIDLGDTKLFDAAVLPAIFIGIKKNPSKKSEVKPKYTSIYETAPADNAKVADSIFEVLNDDNSGVFNVNDTFFELKKGILRQSTDKSGIWQLDDNKDSSWISKIEANTSFRIKDKFKVRVGIKSCADNVFITQQWIKEGFEIEDDLLRPMLSQENIDTWNIDRNAIIKVLYPHYSDNGKRMVYDISHYPNAKRYLESHREQLEGRTYLIKAKRNWYEFWVPQNPVLWKFPKIVFPDISVKPRFCFDKTGAVVNGNCYWICAQNEVEENLLLLIEGVCNSSIMTKYHDAKFTNKLYSGRRRYLSQYIEEYPIPNPDSDISRQIVLLVDRINNTSDGKEKDILASEVDKLVENAFGLTD
ncbi:MAG: N-6 DNA methylase [Paludibacteraceae bacterium]|nr:N-6 DNA methylase [Paludibacteraceae bacterium]